ncbi:MAG: SWIM zinc finger family protein [Cyanobacteria bacterium J06598_3]
MAIAETSQQNAAEALSWTAEQVLSLSPDAGSTKRGKMLAHITKWPLLGAANQAMWGECQGSGKKPYRTIIDLSTIDLSAIALSAIDLSAAGGEPAFKCSCPSRKFPCKHALALFLLRIETTEFKEGAPPAWVSEWLEKRSQTAAKKEAKKQAKKQATTASLSDDEKKAKAEQAAKRANSRTAKVEAGLEDLDQWLQDIMRQGLASLPTQPYSFWDNTAARLVDAQAPGLASRVRSLAGIPHTGEDWPNRMLTALGKLHLLVQGYRQKENLAPAMQAEVRSRIGWNHKQETLLEQANAANPLVESLSDTWHVLGKVVTEEENLKTQRVWLWGGQHQKAGFVLSFAHGRRQPLDSSLRPGMSFQGKLVFYPGTGVQRAFVTERNNDPKLDLNAERTTLGVDHIATAIEHYGQTLVQNPWTIRFPMILRNISLRYQQGAWWLQDEPGQGLPIAAGFSQGWELLALGGGRPLSAFGEWNGTDFMPLSVWSNRKFMALSPSAGTSNRQTARQTTRQTARQSYGSPQSDTWQKYMSAALVGTDRQVPTLPQGKDALSTMVRQLAWSEPASALLGVAGAIALHQAVGQQPTSPALTAIDPCEPDRLPSCRPPIAKYCDRALKEHPMVLPELLDLMAAAGQRLSPTGLPALLSFGVKNPHLQAQILPVLGNRGRWLARQKPSWQYACTQPEQLSAMCQQQWQTANDQPTTIQRRVRIFEQWRTTDPEGARTALAAIWPTETAKNRSAFIHAFFSHVSIDDEPFLEAALADRSQAVRTDAATLLAQIPTSSLCQRMSDRISHHIQFQGSGHQLTLTIKLPEHYDKAWKKDGIAAPPIQGLGEKAGWLQQLIEKTPLSHWPQDFENVARVIKTHEWREPLITGWAKATLSQKHAPEAPRWADALLHTIGVAGLNEETLISLVMLLSQPQRETYLRASLPKSTSANRNDNSTAIWLRIAAQPPQRWDYAFSQLALSQLMQLLKEKRRYGELFRPSPTLAITLHPGLAAEANRAITNLAYEQTFPPAWQRFLDEFLPALTLRWDIYQAFANSS